MAKEGFRTVTLKDETYSILKAYANKLNRSIPETMHSLLRGLEGVRSLNFYQEYICLDCGFQSSNLMEMCPVCKGIVCVRYVVKS